MLKHIVLAAVLGASCTAAVTAAPVPQAALADHGYFFSGGGYQKDSDGPVGRVRCTCTSWCRNARRIRIRS